jgi:hypothetical protein
LSLLRQRSGEPFHSEGIAERDRHVRFVPKAQVANGAYYPTLYLHPLSLMLPAAE